MVRCGPGFNVDSAALATSVRGNSQTRGPMIPFPDIAPEIFTITLGGFSFSLRWYALAYLAGLILGWRLIVAMIRHVNIRACMSSSDLFRVSAEVCDP